ncbi:alpha/beta fold hydrolase [Streptomyces zingiberis]|uniref:Alpha/beta hydrolase n=1 Tax=Streptomyces zingiberis TaxID=2053010 RepID=A0ABX1BWB4_9ACTN|nr:alpha/beta hydrolase [Streptomyces zingiberis]NJQ00175.1 alpha/beta hydrolase [Streptomyces zingiberis]
MRIDIDGTSLEVLDTRGDGPAVLLLHGFPDTHALWRRQIPFLTVAGHRVIAPDLRGFGGSGRPRTVPEYGLAHHVRDQLGILDRLGVERAHVVGHDWGATVAWRLATAHPERVASLTALSAGHPAAFAAGGSAQREKSWYMLLFQFPAVAERWLAEDDFRNLREWSGHPDADEVAARLREPEALRAALALYRAAVPPDVFVSPPYGVTPVPATVPVLGVWSSGDTLLTERAMTASATHVAGPWQYRRIEGCGHWIPLDAADRLGLLLLGFLGTPVG